MFFKRKKKVCVIGLDCASPKLIFKEFKEHLPNLRKIAECGAALSMRSIHPPITIPAWMSMCSGNDAGRMGLYGFRTRTAHSYTDFNLSTSASFSRVEKIWDILAARKRKSILVGVPPTYPVYPINGHMVSGFICPDAKSDFTYPASLKGEIEDCVGEYLFDVAFRTDDRDTLMRNAWEMTEKRFAVIEYLLKKKPWDFFMCVEIGVDRIQHAFWKYYDSSHHLYEPDHKYKYAILDYYKLLDEKIGRILSLLDNDTIVFIVSDHGVKAMKGAFCLNEWLIEKGYLVLRSYPGKVERFENLDVDWGKTRAWGWGGYYGRIFINKQGRESSGIVKEDEYEYLRERLIKELEQETGASGEQLKTRVYKPESLYETVNGDPADLMAYFDDLSYRSAGTVGHKRMYLGENDTGPDDAMHDWDGVFIMYDPRGRGKELPHAINILEFAPLILRTMGISHPLSRHGA